MSLLVLFLVVRWVPFGATEILFLGALWTVLGRLGLGHLIHAWLVSVSLVSWCYLCPEAKDKAAYFPPLSEFWPDF